MWTLHKAATQSILHPNCMRIECLTGYVWLTHDGDPRDIVLQAPATHLADRDSRLLIHAFDDAKVRASIARPSELGLLTNLQRNTHVDAEVAPRASPTFVSKEQLHRTANSRLLSSRMGG
jgi:hypothetical protein